MAEQNEYERAWEAFNQKWGKYSAGFPIVAEAFSAGWQAALDAAEAQTKRTHE